MVESRTLSLTVIAKRIDVHLSRMEQDPAINVETGHMPNTPVGQGTRRFFNASALRLGNRCGIKYISYQNWSTLTRSEALLYLAALDQGSTDRHFEVLRRLRVEEPPDGPR